MSRHKLFYEDAKSVRESLNEVIALAEQIHAREKSLVEKLHFIDQRKLYVRYGYRSLTGFCRTDLRFGKTQSQRIVTQVRRYIPTANILDGQAIVGGGNNIYGNANPDEGVAARE